MRSESPSDRIALTLWRLAGAFVALALVAALTNRVYGADALDHLNNARWLCGGSERALMIDHRPPTLTLVLLPLAFAYELFGLSADNALHGARVLSALALGCAAAATGAAAPGSWRSRAATALLVASSPLLLALAPVFSHDVCAAAGVGLVLWLYRRTWRGSSTVRVIQLGLVAGAVALIRFDTGVVLAGVLVADSVCGRWRRSLAVAALAGGTMVVLLGLQFGLRHGAGAIEGLQETFALASAAVQQEHELQHGPVWLYTATWMRTAGPLVMLLAGVGFWKSGVLRREPVALAAVVALALAVIEHLLATNAQPRYMAQLVPLIALLAVSGLGEVQALPWVKGRERLAVAALVAWPVVLGAWELAAFRDPVYRRSVAGEAARTCEAGLGSGGRVWLIGGNHFARPEARAAFVAGDYATRSYVTGVGGLNYYLRRPVYLRLGEVGWALRDAASGDVAVVVESIDHRAWPLQRSAPVRVVAIGRDELARRGDALEPSAGGVEGTLGSGSIGLRSGRDLGPRFVVLEGPEPVALGVVELRAGERAELAWRGEPFERVVLIDAREVALVGPGD